MPPPRPAPLLPSAAAAPQLTTCCFDKTGTLTSDHMVMEGVAGSAGREGEMVADVKALPAAVISRSSSHSFLDTFVIVVSFCV